VSGIERAKRRWGIPKANPFVYILIRARIPFKAITTLTTQRAARKGRQLRGVREESSEMLPRPRGEARSADLGALPGQHIQVVSIRQIPNRGLELSAY
jgi:hypothetical protein